MADGSPSSSTAEPEFESPGEAELVRVLGGPFEIYAERLLRVVPKGGGKAKPFKLNRAQKYVHDELEKQLQRMGMVRALILKGRQMGISTYVGGRFFRRNHALEGVSTCILSHEIKSTTVLFNHPKRFYTNLPENIRPEIGRIGADTLEFADTGSRYTVMTAGSKETGRSQTNQNFHGSEVAFWPNAESHMAASLESVPMAPGTEIILESTANGIGGVFHEMWLKAERGEGDFIAIFTPWFWDDEYRREAPKAWAPVEEEIDYQQVYALDRDQAYWLHLKNIALGGTAGKIFWKFRQEYPANAEEAFQSGGTEGVIRPLQVVRARNNSMERKGLEGEILPPMDPDPMAPKLLGVDVARNLGSGDATHLIDRWGRVAGSLVNRSIYTDNTMAIVGAIIHVHDEFQFDRIFIDLTGVGAGVYDRLRELGWQSRICGVVFGSEALEPARFLNKRAEMWWAMREWFETPGGVAVPDDQVLHRHLCGPQYEYNSANKLVIESKEKIRKRAKFSPDRADGLCLTFAERVVKSSTAAAIGRYMPRRTRNGATAMAR
jgi:hypothetical protein